MPLQISRRRRLAGAAAALAACGASLSTIFLTSQHSPLNDGARGVLVGLPLGLSILVLILSKRKQPC